MNMLRDAGSDNVRKTRAWSFVVFAAGTPAGNSTNSWMINGPITGPWRPTSNSSGSMAKRRGCRRRKVNGAARAVVLKWCGIRKNAPAAGNWMPGRFRNNHPPDPALGKGIKNILKNFLDYIINILYNKEIFKFIHPWNGGSNCCQPKISAPAEAYLNGKSRFYSFSQFIKRKVSLTTVNKLFNPVFLVFYFFPGDLFGIIQKPFKFVIT